MDDDNDRKLTSVELVNAARFAAAYGADVEGDEYDEMVGALLERCDDKLRGIAFVMSATDDLIADMDAQRVRAESVVRTQGNKRDYLDELGHRLAVEALGLAQKVVNTDSSPEAWSRLQRARKALQTASWRGWPIWLGSTPEPKAAADLELVWAHRTLSALQGKGRQAMVVKALEQHDDPLMAARYITMAAKRRVECLKDRIKAMGEALSDEEDVISAAKGLIESTLGSRVERADEQLDELLDSVDGGEAVLDVLTQMHSASSKERKALQPQLSSAIRGTSDPKAVRKAIGTADAASKHTDVAKGWVRLVTTRRASAVTDSWDGNGRPKSPDTDSVPEEFVKTERTLRKAELTKAIKGGQEVEGVRLHTSTSISVRMSK